LTKKTSYYPKKLDFSHRKCNKNKVTADKNKVRVDSFNLTRVSQERQDKEKP